MGRWMPLEGRGMWKLYCGFVMVFNNTEHRFWEVSLLYFSISIFSVVLVLLSCPPLFFLLVNEGRDSWFSALLFPNVLAFFLQQIPEHTLLAQLDVRATFLIPVFLFSQRRTMVIIFWTSQNNIKTHLEEVKEQKIFNHVRLFYLLVFSPVNITGDTSPLLWYQE